MIGVDWGSTNLRAFRFASDGEVVATRMSPQGIAGLGPGETEAVLGELLASWLGDESDIILAGMVGSRGGWVETGYIPCPADVGMLAEALVEVTTAFGRCLIVPGVCSAESEAVPDVMRGEETQLMGSRLRDGRVVLPGTHSKWVTLTDGAIAAVRTAMTGELYALLSRQSQIGALADEERAPSSDAFARGVAQSLSDPALSMTLFSIRAAVLLGRIAPTDVLDYLSGLLIGAEVAAMTTGEAAMTIIGDPLLVRRYREALALAGHDRIDLIDGTDAVAKGLWAIATASGAAAR